VPLTEAGDVASRPTLERRDLVWGSGRILRIYGELRGALGSAAPEPGPSGLHQRYDPLTASWIAVSPARNVRPDSSTPAWPGTDAGEAPPGCPLCPGGPEVPFSYQAAVFDNRFPSFMPDPPPPPDVAGAVADHLAGSLGRCEVVLYTENHVGSLATLSPEELARVVAVWRDRTTELWAGPRHAFVMAFENRGEAVGATISHPHGQIYAVDRLPPFIAGRIEALADARLRRAAACLACEVVARESAGPRLLAENTSFAVSVPFAARWPYEVHVRARRHGLRRLSDLRPDEQVDLARALHDVVSRYDSLFGIGVPYMMVFLEAPDGAPEWHLGVEFLPPHRTERLLKVRASVETATGLFINDTLPEESAARLREIQVTPRDEASPPIVEVTAG
jgi:UDPglucose--hexose-1-phosphate uridylyltransferase